MIAKLLTTVALVTALTLPTAAQERPTSRPSQAADAAPQELVIQVAPSTVKDSIDRAVKHLRSTLQEDGSYDGSIVATSQVLIALAECPRKYRVIDGPFITRAVTYLESQRGPTGLIVDPRISANETRIRSTLLAAKALAAVETRGYVQGDDAKLRALVEAAKNVDAATAARVQDALLPAPKVLESMALVQLLATQGEDGNFGQARPAGTAHSIRNLTATWTALRAKEVKSAAEVAPLPTFEPGDRTAALAAMQRGVRFLVTEGQIAPGRWGSGEHADPGITAMVLSGLLTLPEPRDEATTKAIDEGLAWLLSLQKPDGSIHAGQLQNYVTSASVLALAQADAERYAGPIGRARAFLTELQADEGEGYTPDDKFYGGVGYGGDLRPDLSNLHMALEALSAAGADGDDPAMKKALKFLERTQNRKESNDISLDDGGDEGLIQSGDDGGAAYMPGDSKAGFEVLADGTRVPRSYGSMTFALLKGFLLAGLEKDDPRVAAAHGWLQRNYTLDKNPGFEASADPGAAYQGLFYYFLALARALELYDEPHLTDGAGVVHNWRGELAGRLVSMQLGDGSWVNSNSPRWYEGNPTLATAYALCCLGAVIE
ncbi:MAG: terpene cyclase/mutase family protein [Planctomycetota bacterium]|nr:terpene cyclase/mutase family protein [Planctomycetota bacterium]